MMGGFSIWHWLIVIAVVAVVFGGRGKLSGLMGDAAKGIKAFITGCWGLPAKLLCTSICHQCSFWAATVGSCTSSTTSSTSRQNA